MADPDDLIMAAVKRQRALRGGLGPQRAMGSTAPIFTKDGTRLGGISVPNRKAFRSRFAPPGFLPQPDERRSTIDPQQRRVTNNNNMYQGVGFGFGGRRSIGSGSRVLEDSSIDFAGLNAFQNASPQQQAAMRQAGINPNIQQFSWTGPSGSMPRQGTLTPGGSGMGASLNPAGRQQAQAAMGGGLGGGGGFGGGGFGVPGGLGQLNDTVNQLLQRGGLGGGLGGDASMRNIDLLRRNSLISRGNREAAAQASQIRQRGAAGGFDPGVTERRVLENNALQEQARRDSLASNSLATRASEQQDIALALQARGIEADLAARLAQAAAQGGLLF